MLGKFHIYDDHINELKEQIQREPYNFPSITISKKDNINDYVLEDIIVNDYNYHPPIKMKMRK